MFEETAMVKKKIIIKRKEKRREKKERKRLFFFKQSISPVNLRVCHPLRPHHICLAQSSSSHLVPHMDLLPRLSLCCPWVLPLAVTVALVSRYEKYHFSSQPIASRLTPVDKLSSTGKEKNAVT